MNPRHASELARRYSLANAESMRARLPNLGESLHTAAIELNRDLTIERIDLMMAWLKGAESSLMHLRRALKESVA